MQYVRNIKMNQFCSEAASVQCMWLHDVWWQSGRNRKAVVR
jgi:hypothetical protein